MNFRERVIRGAPQAPGVRQFPEKIYRLAKTFFAEEWTSCS
jgi:hypothetical protein